jgi:hypothetical protein
MKYVFLFFPLLFADCISGNLAHKTCIDQDQKKEVKAKTIANQKPIAKQKSVAKQKPEMSFTLFIKM